MTAGISEVEIGSLPNGKIIKKYCLRNESGAQASFLNLGASWIEFKLAKDEPSLVLGCTTLDAFADQQAYLGATVGRYANRIKNGQFMLNGEKIQLDKNQASHHLHGGNQGISFKVWDSHIELKDDKTPTLTFHCQSEDGESGFPGNVDITLTITLTETNDVQFKYSATTDKPTILNLTNHAYFNLDGSKFGNLNNHQFKLNSTTFLDIDASGIPTGLLIDACDSAMNLTEWQNIKTELSELTEPHLALCEGYDHCYCFKNDHKLKTMASAQSPHSGRKLICKSNLPGMQFYTANFLQGTPVGDGDSYRRHGAFCFEPGFWTDSPNHAHFPDCTIDPDNSYSAIIEYSFS